MIKFCANYGLYDSTPHNEFWWNLKLITTTWGQPAMPNGFSIQWHGWFRWIASHLSAQGCAFWGFRWYCTHLGVISPKTQILWAWIGVFKPNVQSIKNSILSQLLHWFQPNLHNSKRPPSRDVLEFEFERCQNPTILGKSEIWQIHILRHFNAVGVVHVLVKILLY